jgi:putative salt-induced outer membrane protein
MKTNLLLALSLALSSNVAFAQAKPDGQFHGTFAAGLSFASGNTSSNALNLTADTAAETANDKTTLYGLVTRASNKSSGISEKTSDLFRVGGRYDRNLSDRLFAYGGLELERDKIAALKLRTGVSAGLGYKVIRDATTTFDVFGGVAYTSNDFEAPLKDTKGFGVQIGEESTHKLSATSTFKQRLVVNPAGGDVGTRAAWDASLSTALAGSLSLNVGLGMRYAAKVPTGVKKTDSLLIVGVGYKF